VGALILRRGRILLVERGQEPLKGYWSLPGGAVETGELLEDALRREVREETGLEVRPVAMFKIFERILRDARDTPEYHFVVVDYRCRVVGGELRPGDDVSQVAWVPEKSLSAYRLTEGTGRVIEEAFRRR